MEAKYYIKNPVIVEATQLKNDFYYIKNCFEFVFGKSMKLDDILAIQKNNGMDIETLNGIQHVSWGDYIVKDVKKGFRIYKQEIFEKNYREENIAKYYGGI